MTRLEVPWRDGRMALAGALLVTAVLGAAAWSFQAGFQETPVSATSPPLASGPVASTASAPLAPAQAPAVAQASSQVAAAVPSPAAPSPAATAIDQVLGFDISKWNGQAGDDAVIDDSLASFVFTRASYGLSLDPSFARNWQRMAGRSTLWRGAYHFFAMQDDPLLQAQHFLKVVGEASPQDPCPTVDFEEASLPSRGTALSVAQVQSALLAHLDYLERHAGCVPILYTDVSMGNRYLADARFSRYPLWIADWTSTQAQPTLPHAWAGGGYRFWQRSASYTLPTTPRSATDLDVFAGTRSQLQALRRRGK